MITTVIIRGTMDNPEKRRDLGRRVEVCWDADGRFYRGTIVAFHPTSGKHTVMYDAGDKEKLKLDEVPHRCAVQYRTVRYAAAQRAGVSRSQCRSLGMAGAGTMVGPHARLFCGMRHDSFVVPCTARRSLSLCAKPSGALLPVCPPLPACAAAAGGWSTARRSWR